MQRTVVVLQGRMDSGKTFTICLAWKLLKNHPGVKVRRNWRPGFKEIRCAILEVDGVLVGFISIAEPTWRLEEYLNRLIEEDGCAIIVCATRSARTASEELVNSLRQRGWRIKWIPKDRNPAEDQERAEEIVAEVLSAVERSAPVEA